MLASCSEENDRAPLNDASQPPLDVGTSILDAMMMPDAGSADADFRFDYGPTVQPTTPNEAPITISPGGLELTAQDLERLNDESHWLRFVATRLTPQVPILGDTSPLQPWFVYRPAGEAPWRWLILSLMTPDGTPLEIEVPRGLRLFAQRTGPWHARSGQSITPVPSGLAERTLISPESTLCGKASMAARFRIITPGQTFVPDVVGFAYSVLPSDRFHMDWLVGCTRTTIP
jgi:hypothetical protein